jgi:hypothetical protein
VEAIEVDEAFHRSFAACTSHLADLGYHRQAIVIGAILIALALVLRWSSLDLAIPFAPGARHHLAHSGVVGLAFIGVTALR